MLKTSCSIVWGLIDPQAKPNSDPRSEDRLKNRNGADLIPNPLRGLMRDEEQWRNLATCERDYWRGDGSFQILPDQPSADIWPWWTWSQSSAERDAAHGDYPFAAAPMLTVRIQNGHIAGSPGITLFFDEYNGDFAARGTVEWKLNGKRLGDDVYHFTATRAVHEIAQECSGYDELIITFEAMNKPQRFLKLTAIEYGLMRVLNKELESAGVLEEMDITSAELPGNRLDVSFIDPDLNLLDPASTWMTQAQPLRVRGYINQEQQDLGLYYLESWKSEGDDVSVLAGADHLDRMGKAEFAGNVYENEPFEHIIRDIFLAYDPINTRYSIPQDDALHNLRLSGWIPRCTAREALQQTAFAAGAAVDSSRSQVVRIYTAPGFERQPDADGNGNQQIGVNRRSMDQQLAQEDQVTHVRVVAYAFTAADEEKTTELVKREGLPEGVYTFTYSDPAVKTAINCNVPYAIISESSNHIELNLEAGNAEVRITGRPYERTEAEATRQDPDWMPHMPKHQAEVDEGYLICKSTAAEYAAWQAQRLVSYYKNRYINDFSVVLLDPDENRNRKPELQKPGDFVSVAQKRSSVEGRIRRIQTDLTGGFVQQLSVRGGRNDG